MRRSMVSIIVLLLSIGGTVVFWNFLPKIPFGVPFKEFINQSMNGNFSEKIFLMMIVFIIIFLFLASLIGFLIILIRKR